MTTRQRTAAPAVWPRPERWAAWVRLLARWRPSAGLRLFSGLLFSVWMLVLGYQQTLFPVYVVVNGEPIQLRTHQTTIEGLLAEMGGKLYPEDIVWPARSGPLPQYRPLQIELASLVQVSADGRTWLQRTHVTNVGDLLRELGVLLGDHDRVMLDGKLADVTTPLTSPPPSLQNRPASRLTIRRAVPVYVDDDGVPMQFDTLAPTIGEALWQQNVLLYLGDQVFPPLGTPTSPGIRVHIRRSRPITLLVDGRERKTRSRAKTVGAALDELGITLGRLDRVEPRQFVALRDNMSIRVVRVRQEILTEQEPIPFETRWRPDPNLEIDQRRVDQSGVPGVFKRNVQVTYEDGKEAHRGVVREWVDREPVDEIISYGTKIVIRELDTPEGKLRYWRKVRLLATSYTAATSGKSRSHPLYGITRLGLRAGKGIVAVDPRVVKLGSYVYVPGYGKALVGDTGGRILGRRIDLGFDEGSLQLWYRWVDVYLLAPAPPASRIRYILPGWPRERRRR